MAHEKDRYEMDKVPDFAMQPAREDIDTFDPTVYEKLFSELAPLEQEVAEPTGTPMDELTAAFERLIAEGRGFAGVGAETEAETEIEFGAGYGEATEGGGEPQSEPSSVEEVSAEEETVEATEQDVTEIEVVAEEAEEELEDMHVMAPAPVAPSAPAGPVSVAPSGGSIPAPAKIIPAGSSVLSNRLKMTDIRAVPQIKVWIEEDILVPDVKPDLASVLSMEAAVKLGEREISVGAQAVDFVKLSGDLMVSTLYLPDKADREGSIIAIESRIPFKEDISVRSEAYSDMIATAEVESIDFTVVNERKFKVKAAVVLHLKEYRALNLELFEGLRDEEVQMLSEKLHLTDVALRKTENMELTEELAIKDGVGGIGKILRCDVNVVENHKQIMAEKAVISGTVYINAMYMTREAEAFDEEEGRVAEPMLYQGKTEFTQFIKLDGEGTAERAAQNPVGSKVSFRVVKAELSPSVSEEERAEGFNLSMEISTTLELYKDVEKEIVTDVYHHRKEMRYDTQEISMMSLCGSGVAEVSAREIINVPEKYGSVDRVVYITGRMADVKVAIDAGKNVTEGVVSLSMICIAADEGKTPFSLSQKIPFRSAIDIPGVKSDMEADSEALLKELWYDKINNRQIEVNAGVLVNTMACSREKHPLIKNVSFVEVVEGVGNEPSIILYITREGDNVWRIAKKYRTTIENIRRVNGIDDSGKLKPGTKLLIVK